MRDYTNYCHNIKIKYEIKNEQSLITFQSSSNAYYYNNISPKLIMVTTWSAQQGMCRNAVVMDQVRDKE